MDDMKVILGTNLSKYLKENNMTQNDLANHLNISHTAVNKWVKGYNYPDFAYLFQMCELFKVTLHDFFGIDIDNEFNEHEKRLIYSYRDKPNVREAIDVLLNINNEKK